MKKILSAMLLVVATNLLAQDSTLTKTVQKQTAQNLTLKAVGDMMLGSRTPKSIIPTDSGKAFVRNIAPLLRDAQIVFGNCEGVFATSDMQPSKCSEASRRAGKCYEFGMPAHLAPSLKGMGFTVFSLDNNHVGDYGARGYANTQAVLKKEGLLFATKKNYASLTINGKRVAVQAFGFSDESYTVSDVETAKRVIKALREEQKFDVVIASFHGGAEGKGAQHVKNQTEMFYGENRGNLIAFAHAVIDAGADLVIGHGPHVLRALELYKGKLIAYSLGNFLTYGNVNIDGVPGVGAILSVELDSTTNNFVKGSIIPTIQDAPGVPRLDETKKAIKLMRDLTAEDFPKTPIAIDAEGNIAIK
jgi:hypothetical protein